MVKLVLKIIGVILLVGYLLVAGVVYGIKREPARYRDIQIVVTDSADAQFVRASDIRRRLNEERFDPIGKTYSEVNTYQLANMVEQNKLVKKADCYHTPDSLLRIDIVQRHPIMRVKSSIAGDFYIDTEGEIMPYQPGVAIRLPLVTGRVPKEMVKEGLFDFALFLNSHRQWKDAITQINVNERGDVELIPRVGSHTILLGSLNNVEKKLDRLLVFYDKVLSRKGWNAYSVINVKFDGQVVGETAK